MGGFQRRYDALKLGRQLERFERLVIKDRHVFHAASVTQPGMLRANARIVQAGGDRVAVQDLAVVVLEQLGAVAVENAGAARVHGSAMLDAIETTAASFDADDLDVLVIEEWMEDANGVRSAADCSDDHVRKASF